MHSMKNRNQKYIDAAEKKYQQREATVEKYYSEHQTEWKSVEAQIQKTVKRPKNKKLFRDACIALLIFMRFDDVKEKGKRRQQHIKSLLWGKFFNQSQNLIQKMFTPFRGIKNSDLPILALRIKPPKNSGPIRDENFFAELAGGGKYDIQEPEYVIDTYLKDPIFNKYYSEFSADEYTPPVTPTELSDKLGINPSIISNRKKPLGKYFHECCEDQHTKTPRLQYDDLFPLARKCIQQSKKTESDKRPLNDIDELINFWI